jgi:hypothetical protein
MGRHSWTQKLDQCSSISTFFLKKHGYLKYGLQDGEISWNVGGRPSGSAIFYVNKDNKFMVFGYAITDISTGESRDVSYKTLLTTTSCNYGGVRYWFVCPGCNRCAGVVYRFQVDRFLCRHCVGLQYSSQSADPISRRFGVNYSYSDLEKMRKKLRVTHYDGKPTKRYKRYLELSGRMDRAMSWCSASL